MVKGDTHMTSTLREGGGVKNEMLSDVGGWGGGVSECSGSPIFIFFVKENWILRDHLTSC